MEVPRLIAPIPTPYTDDGSTISEIRLARLIRRVRESGFEGVLIASDAGEWASLSLAERKKLCEWVARDAHGMAIYVNATAQTTAIAIDLCQDAHECGAVGAVLCPPPHGILTKEEAVNYLNVVRRHGKIPVGFLDPSGHLSEAARVGESSATRVPEPLSAHAMEAYASNPHGSSIECWTPSGIVHPAALFGRDHVDRIFLRWDAFRPILVGLLKLAGSARVAKYAMEKQGIECGPLRGPFMPLSPQGQEIADRIMGTA